MNRQFNIFYYVFLICILLNEILIRTQIPMETFNKTFYIVGASYIIIYFFSYITTCLTSKQFNFKEVIYLGVFGIITVLVFLTNKSRVILISQFILIMSSKNIDIRNIFKINLFTRLFTIIIVAILAILNIIPNELDLKYYYYNEGIIVYGNPLGFLHPNGLYWNLFVIFACLIYLYFDKLKVVHILLLMGISYIFYLITLSRTGFICALILFILYFIFKKIDINIKISKICLTFFYSIIALINVIFPIYYSSSYEIMVKISKLLSGRLYWANKIYQLFGIKLWGNSIPYSSDLILDNLYSYLLFDHGVVFFILLCIGFTLLSRKLLRYGYKKEIFIIAIFAIYGITERYGSNIFQNLSYLFLLELIYPGILIKKE